MNLMETTEMLSRILKPQKPIVEHNPISISIDEKQFYLSLYNSLPTDYSLAFHSDIINLNSFIMQDKSSFSKGCAFLEKFNNQTVDFIVLDHYLQACAVILFDHPKGSKTHGELYQTLVELGIPVFTYTKTEDYEFNDLLKFLRH